jgi:hypothetical protein
MPGAIVIPRAHSAGWVQQKEATKQRLVFFGLEMLRKVAMEIQQLV